MYPHFQILTGLFSITYRPLDSSTPQYREFVDQIAEASARLPETEEDSHLPPPTDPEVISICSSFVKFNFSLGLYSISTNCRR